MTEIIDKVLRTAKAWVAAALIVVTSLNDVLADNAVSLAEVGVVTSAAVAGWSLVYAVGNKKKNDEQPQ